MTDLQPSAAVRPAAELVAATVRAVGSADPAVPTPCSDYDLRGLLDHLGWAVVLFQHSARKSAFDHDWSVPSVPPALAGEPASWGESLADELTRTAEAWADPASWDGETVMGSSPMPAAFVGEMLVAELALHGWDLARATGQPYEVSAQVGETALAAVESMAQMGRDGGWYGSEVPVAAAAPAFDRALGLSGRDPGWAAG